MAAAIYTPEYRGALETVFGVRGAFAGAFQNLQILEGIRSNATAFIVKTNNTPVVIKNYDKGANVAFGTGTGKSSRFGERTEIIYTDTPVPYDYLLSIHEGLDITTVNADLDKAVMDRLYAQSEAQTSYMNKENGKFLSTSAGVTEVLADLTPEAILALFNKMAAYQINKEIIGKSTAYVRPDLYNAIVDHPLVTSSKGSSVNIDGNSILEFKGFIIESTPEQYFVAGDAAYVAPANVAVPFVGIELARTFPSEDFAGLALQALAKGGKFMLDDNKVAVIKVTNTAVGG